MLSKIKMIFLMMLISQGAFAFGDFAKKPGGSESSGGSQQVEALQDKLVGDYVTAVTAEMEGKALILEALGAKDEAAKLSVEAESVKSDGIKDVDRIKKVIAVNEEADSIALEKMGAAESVSGDAKAAIAKGLASYSKSVVATKDLLPGLKDFSSAAANEVKSAGLQGAKKVKDRLAVGMFLSKELPGHYKKVLGTGAKFIEFAKSNDVDTPKDSTDALGW